VAILPWKTQRFWIAYVFGVLTCWVTQVLFWGIWARRGSLLSFTLFRLEETLRVSAARVIGHEVIGYPPPLYAGSVIFAALLGAVMFAGAFWASSEKKRALRSAGYIALALLALMTLYWPIIPNDLF